MIQELHLPIYHCLCLMLEDRFFAWFMTKPCSKHGYAIQICCLNVADGRQRSVYALSGKSIRTSLKWSMNKKLGNLWIISPAFWSNTPFKRFFRIQGLSLLIYAFFSLAICFLFCKRADFPLDLCCGKFSTGNRQRIQIGTGKQGIQTIFVFL